MDCSIFQDKITDYLDGELEPCAKAEVAAHRLRCRECRQLFSEVRDTIGALKIYAQRDEVPSLENLEARILDVTSTGAMLSCDSFDRLLEKYFDGVILGPTFQTFQAHFEQCVKCRRLMRGIEEAIDLCREAKEAEIEVPETLSARILSATSGPAQTSRFSQWRRQALNVAQAVWTPQWAAAALIFAASGLIVSTRFGSIDNMADRASSQAERLVSTGQEAINQTEVMAVSGMQILTGGLTAAKSSERKRTETNHKTTETPHPIQQQTPPPQQQDE